MIGIFNWMDSRTGRKHIRYLVRKDARKYIDVLAKRRHDYSISGSQIFEYPVLDGYTRSSFHPFFEKVIMPAVTHLCRCYFTQPTLGIIQAKMVARQLIRLYMI